MTLFIELTSRGHRPARRNQVGILTTLCAAAALTLFGAASTPRSDAATRNASTAGQPIESVLPPTTKAWLSIPNYNLLEQNWNACQFGKLINDPAMKPFLDDISQQAQDGLGWLWRLGLNWSDLKDVLDGEVCLALIQPEGNSKQHAQALLLNISGRRNEAKDMVARLSQRLLNDGARRDERQQGGAKIMVFTAAPPQGETQPRQICYALSGDWFIAVDHVQVISHMLERLGGRPLPSLPEDPAFTACMQHCQAALGDAQPQLRWFVEPFGAVETLRAIRGGTSSRGVDYSKVLRNQGFGVIQGVGGFVTFATGPHEALHQTFIYAPGADQPGAEVGGFPLAARMLDFPNRPSLLPDTWVPADVGVYAGISWRIRSAFDFSKTLVNEIAGDDIFDDMLNDIATDPSGPRLDIRNNVLAHFADRATVLLDPNRRMLIVQLNNPQAVAQAFSKSMSTDEFAQKHVIRDFVIWELLDDSEELDDPEFSFDDDDNDELEEEIQEGNPLLQFNSVCVAHDHLILATHRDSIENLLNSAAAGNHLARSAEYRRLSKTLEDLGAGNESLRFFIRLSKMLQPPYDKLRAAKATKVSFGVGALQIHGDKLPDFQVVERLAGAIGFYARTHRDGWLLAGCLEDHTDPPAGAVTALPQNK